MPDTPAAPLPYLVFDFDSTFTQVEGLDELADIALAGQPNQTEVVNQIRALTDRGMSGEIGLQDSLRQRLALLGAHRGSTAVERRRPAAPGSGCGTPLGFGPPCWCDRG